MIADPMASRLQVGIIGTGVTSADANADMIGFGPGSRTTRAINTIPASWSGAIIKCGFVIEHAPTKSGRMRSLIRADVTGAAVGDSYLPGVTASAYLVVDHPVTYVNGNIDKNVVDAAVSALLNTLVMSKPVGSDFVATQALKDFVGGEP